LDDAHEHELASLLAEFSDAHKARVKATKACPSPDFYLFAGRRAGPEACRAAPGGGVMPEIGRCFEESSKPGTPNMVQYFGKGTIVSNATSWYW
jgi:hypothetical protein